MHELREFLTLIKSRAFKKTVKFALILLVWH